MVNDGLPALALTMEPEEEEIMNKKLNDSKKQLFDFESRFLTVVITFMSALTSLWIFWYFLQTTGNTDLARTATFTALGIDTLFYVFSIKSLEHNILKAKPFRNKYLNGAVIIGLAMQMVAIYVPFFNRALRTQPLSWDEWKVILIVIFGTVAVIEIIKGIFIKYYKNKQK